MASRLPIYILFCTSIAWGMSWWPIKTITQMGISPPVFIAFISTSIAAVLLPCLYWQRHHWRPYPRLMLLVGLFGGLSCISFQTALAKGDVVRVMILFYMLPVWSIIGGRWILAETMDARRWAALILCLLGAACILRAWDVQWHDLGWVDGFALASGMMLAANNITFRFTLAIPLASKVACMYAGSALFMCLGLLLIPTPGIGEAPLNAFGWALAYALLWLMLVTFGSQWAISRIEAGQSAIILVVELVVAVASVSLISATALAPHEIAGGICVLTAALLESVRAQKR